MIAVLVAVSLALAPLVGAAPVPAAPLDDACRHAPIAPFVDVADDAPHGPAIDCLRWYGVADGVAVDAFGPSRPIRRDQLAAFVARSIDVAGTVLPAGTGRFADLDGNPHADAIERMAAAGIVRGRTTSSYAPRERVTRAEVAALLAAAHATVTGRATTGPDAFVDDDGHRHEASIDAAAAIGVVTGVAAGRFDPDREVTRAQVAAATARLLDVFAREGRLRLRAAGYTAEVSELPAALRRTMTGSSWRPGCPVGLDDLRLVELVHHGFDGRPRWGLLVVHRDVAADVVQAFSAIHAAGFEIERMELVDRYGADDDRSMAANNTSGFNCRFVAGTTRWSNHAYAVAIDINPIQNPYVSGTHVSPPEGRDYRDRTFVRRGMIVDGDAVVDAFASIGWGWGGHWRTAKDYQHVSRDGG